MSDINDFFEARPIYPDLSELMKPIESAMIAPNPTAVASQQIADAMSVLNVFEAIKKYVQAFERSLDPEHEVGAKLTSFGQSVTMVVENIQYEEPNILVFDGLVDGHNATLLQHMSQFNFLLVSLPIEHPEEPKRKIGFGD